MTRALLAWVCRVTDINRRGSPRRLAGAERASLTASGMGVRWRAEPGSR
jgi:hypothetical protein